MSSDASLADPRESLRREAAFLRSILHALPHISVLVTDSEPMGEVRFANRFFCDHNGVTPEEAVGMNAYDFASLPDGDRGKIDDAIRRALAGDGPVRVRAGFRRRDRREGDEPVKGLLLVSRLDSLGHAPLLLFVTIDVGGLGLADELDRMGNPLAKAGWLSPTPEPVVRPAETDPAVTDARRERDFLKAILDHLHNIGVMVCDTEPVGEIRFANTFFCFHNAVTYEQAVTMNANTFASAPDDDMAKLYQAIGRALGGEGPVSVHGYFRSKRQAYSCWGLILVIRLDRPDAPPCLIFATIALSELGLAVERSLMGAAQIRAITTAARDGVVLIDDRGAVTYWNVAAEKLFGVIAVDAIGRHLADLLAAEGERGAFVAALEEQLSLDRPSFEAGTFETVGRGADGAPLPLEISASPVRLEGGGWGGVLFIRDITRRKEAERELIEARESAERASRLKDQFVTLVSHDLRSPLSGVVGALRLSAQMLDGDLPDPVGKLLAQSHDTCMRLLTMVDSLLDLSRLRSGRVAPRPRATEARGFLTGIVSRLQEVAGAKGVALSVTAPFGLRLFADPDLFGQVIHNLAANALKFTDRGGRVTVTVREDDPRTVTVADSGVGIPPERLALLFAAETATSTRGTDGERGHGFGLPLCAELMRVMGGELAVESRPGEGSVFTCRLPESRPVVAVVDDHPLDRQAAIGFLSDTGARFLEAENGEAALTLLKENAPHLALVDLQMPYLDGFALLSRIRQEPATATLPVIVMTADPGAEARSRAFALGADDFVLKPIAPEDFLPRVLRFLSVGTTSAGV